VAEELRAFVASTGTRPDARVVRTVMMRLFAEEAARQQRALTEALESAAPGHVEELRRSLVTVDAFAPTVASPTEQGLTQEPIELPTSRKGPALAAAAIVLILAGVGTAYFVTRTAPIAPETVAAPPPTPTPAPTPTPPPAPTPTPTPSAIPSAGTSTTAPKPKIIPPPPVTTTKRPPSVDEKPF
jgi:hypothetical protein